jgi:hypothetical protein
LTALCFFANACFQRWCWLLLTAVVAGAAAAVVGWYGRRLPPVHTLSPQRVRKTARRSALKRILSLCLRPRALQVRMVREVQAASRKLCHHQISWFRDDGAFRWVDAAQGEAAAVEEVLERWGRAGHEGEGQRGAGRAACRVAAYSSCSPACRRVGTSVCVQGTGRGVLWREWVCVGVG